MKQKQLFCAFLGIALAFATSCKKEAIAPLEEPVAQGPGSNKLLEPLTLSYVDLGSTNDYVAPPGSTVKEPIKRGDLLIFPEEGRAFYALDDSTIMDCISLKTVSLIEFVAVNKLPTLVYASRKRLRSASPPSRNIALQVVKSLNELVEPTFILELRQSKGSIDSTITSSKKSVSTLLGNVYIGGATFEVLSNGVQRYSTVNSIGTVNGPFTYRTSYLYGQRAGESVNMTSYPGKSPADDALLLWFTAFKL